jgi:hypothetical protein
MMTGGAAAVKARGHPPIFCENRFPPRPLARRSAVLRGPDNRIPARLPRTVLNHEDQLQEAFMSMIKTNNAIETNDFEAHFIATEAADYHWNARVNERYLGAYEGDCDGDIELDVVNIIGNLHGLWFVATCIIDGEGRVNDMAKVRHYSSREGAEQAYHGDG